MWVHTGSATMLCLMDHRFWKKKGKSDKYLFKYDNAETLGPFAQVSGLHRLSALNRWS
jgi:hypothetical protein